MAFHLLRALLFISSFLIVSVGLSIFVFGANLTFSMTIDALKPVLPNLSPVTSFSSANVDSELRFLMPFFVGYGILVFLCAKHLRTHLYYVPHLLAVFLAGGIGRLLSYFMVGETHTLFVYLMIIEIGLPILLFLIYKRAVAKLMQG
jgi:hypothetical protein